MHPTSMPATRGQQAAARRLAIIPDSQGDTDDTWPNGEKSEAESVIVVATCGWVDPPSGLGSEGHGHRRSSTIPDSDE